MTLINLGFPEVSAVSWVTVTLVPVAEVTGPTSSGTEAWAGG